MEQRRWPDAMLICYAPKNKAMKNNWNGDTRREVEGGGSYLRQTKAEGGGSGDVSGGGGAGGRRESDARRHNTHLQAGKTPHAVEWGEREVVDRKQGNKRGRQRQKAAAAVHRVVNCSGTDLVKADDRPGVSVAAALVTRTG